MINNNAINNSTGPENSPSYIYLQYRANTDNTTFSGTSTFTPVIVTGAAQTFSIASDDFTFDSNGVITFANTPTLFNFNCVISGKAITNPNEFWVTLNRSGTDITYLIQRQTFANTTGTLNFSFGGGIVLDNAQTASVVIEAITTTDPFLMTNMAISLLSVNV